MKEKIIYTIVIIVSFGMMLSSMFIETWIQKPLLLIGCVGLYFAFSNKDSLPEFFQLIRNPASILFVITCLLLVSFILFGSGVLWVKVLAGVLLLAVFGHRVMSVKKKK
ncbi:MAG: hypothetical protein ACRDD8_13825 [Bacteroidales bacterium]